MEQIGNSGFMQVQIPPVACQGSDMVRTSDNGQKYGLTPGK